MDGWINGWIERRMVGWLEERTGGERQTRTKIFNGWDDATVLLTPEGTLYPDRTTSCDGMRGHRKALGCNLSIKIINSIKTIAIAIM